MKTLEQFIKEAYNFRLGGSQWKGFDQTEYKTFDELEDGDTFYYASLQSDKDSLWKNKFYKMEKGEEIASLYYYKGGRNAVELPIDNLNSSISVETLKYIFITHIVATNAEEIIKEIKKLKHKDYTEADFKDTSK